MMHTEDDVKRILHEARARDKKEIDDLSAQLRSVEFHLAIHRWALASLMSRNIHLNVDVQAFSVMESQDPQRLFQTIAKHAGEQFAHSAGLMFEDHARMAELLDQQRLKWSPHISTERNFEVATGTQKAHWPRP